MLYGTPHPLLDFIQALMSDDLLLARRIGSAEDIRVRAVVERLWKVDAEVGRAEAHGPPF